MVKRQDKDTKLKRRIFKGLYLLQVKQRIIMNRQMRKRKQYRVFRNVSFVKGANTSIINMIKRTALNLKV